MEAMAERYVKNQKRLSVPEAKGAENCKQQMVRGIRDWRNQIGRQLESPRAIRRVGIHCWTSTRETVTSRGRGIVPRISVTTLSPPCQSHSVGPWPYPMRALSPSLQM